MEKACSTHKHTQLTYLPVHINPELHVEPESLRHGDEIAHKLRTVRAQRRWRMAEQKEQKEQKALAAETRDRAVKDRRSWWTRAVLKLVSISA